MNHTVIAFDLDNTLFDADGRAYGAIVSNLLTSMPPGLFNYSAFEAYESARAQGNALERMGLRNPIHERANPDGLAAFLITRGNNPDPCKDLSIDISNQNEHRALLSELSDHHKATRRGPFESRLQAECRLRSLLASDPRVERFRADVKRLVQHPKILEWSKLYRDLELAQPMADHGPLMNKLTSRGFTPIVISEGRASIQREKLDRLGLTDFFAGRVLITETIGSVPGLRELDAAISRMIDARINAQADPDNQELDVLWYFRCLIDLWSGKSPSFFARCLHAIHQSTENPERSLNPPTFVPPTRWKNEPLRFVMIGDRYDKDIEPLIDLLGPNVGLRIHLRMGKYAHRHPEVEIPKDRRPGKTFTNWDSLAGFLTEELTADLIPPITVAPDIARQQDIRLDYIKQGLTSTYQAVRITAHVVREMMKSKV